MKKCLFVLFLVMLYSCSEKGKIVDQMIDIPEAKWSYDQIPELPFTIDNKGIYYNFFLKLRMQKSYPYENLYLLARVKSPDGKFVVQRINFTLTDAMGKPLGRSSGSSVDYELPMFQNKSFSSVGDYTISIEQNMRDSLINGIESIGLKIKQGDPIF